MIADEDTVSSSTFISDESCFGPDVLNGLEIFKSNHGTHLIKKSSLLPFDHQIAGHTREKISRYVNGYVLKPLNKVDLFEREVATYNYLLNRYSNNCPWLARYFGVAKCIPNFSVLENINAYHLSHPTFSIVLEDLTQDFLRPCLVDFKMGQQTYEPNASCDKKSREERKYPYQSEIGFRITGMKVWNSLSNSYDGFDKHFGRSVTPEQVLTAVAKFFFDGKSLLVSIIQSTLSQLKKILVWMEQQHEFRFYCSSILIVYDHSARGKTCMGDSNRDVKVKMIDFAHVVSVSSEDPNYRDIDNGYITGLSNLMNFLDELLRQFGTCDDSSFLSSKLFKSMKSMGIA
jgi:hypothetical protein